MINERIQKLLLELDSPVGRIGNWGRVEWADNVYPQLGDDLYAKVDLEKFAELIVEECINVLMKESERLYKLESEENDELFARDFEVCAEKCVDNVVALKEHFGVEE